MAIKHGQSRDTGNIGHIRHRTKTNKKENTIKHNTTQKSENMSNTSTDPTKTQG